MQTNTDTPNCECCDGSADSKSDAGVGDAGQSQKGQIIRLSIGAAAFTVGMVLKYIAQIDLELSLLAIFAFAYVLLGGGVIWRAVQNIARGKIFDENFLMSIATLGAFAIGQSAEAAGVMLFFRVGEYFQDRAVNKSKRSIADLMDIKPDFANLKVGDRLDVVAPEAVQIGDSIVVKPGEKIPLDGIVTEGQASLDTVALTGESIPRTAKVGDSVFSGFINQSGLLTIKVTEVFAQSTVMKVLELVENAASKKAPTENFITTFARYYTPVVVALAALIAVVPPLAFGGEWMDWISRGLIFLVISCPCALVISIPLGYFGGIGSASKRGILVKGGNYLDALTKVDTVVFDKTGTLTEGVFQVTDLVPAKGFTDVELLDAAAVAEAFSNHPIALSIQKAHNHIHGHGDGEGIGADSVKDYQEIAGQGISVRADGQTILAGNQKLMESHGIDFTPLAGVGTKVYIAVDGTFAGCVVISDKVKADSQTAIAALKQLGVRETVMLTGDNSQIADAIAGQLGIDKTYGDLLPQHKVEQMEALCAEKQRGSQSIAKQSSGKTHVPGKQGTIVFVGDGINDAPVLALADVGVAMGGLGSDAAIEAADVVLMTDEPSKLVEAIKIARKTRRIVWQNIVFALGVKAIFLVLGAAGVASLWEAVFADVGVTVLAILNASRVLRS